MTLGDIFNKRAPKPFLIYPCTFIFWPDSAKCMALVLSSFVIFMAVSNLLFWWLKPPPSTRHDQFMSTITKWRFDEWVRQAKQFTEGLSKRGTGEVKSQVTIERPLEGTAVDSLGTELGRPLPTALRAFLQRGSGSMDFNILWSHRRLAIAGPLSRSTLRVGDASILGRYEV
jgi:hypothetical protein